MPMMLKVKILNSFYTNLCNWFLNIGCAFWFDYNIVAEDTQIITLAKLHVLTNSQKVKGMTVLFELLLTYVQLL